MTTNAGTRAIKYGTNVVIGTILFFVVLVAINFFAAKSRTRLDLTQGKQYTISDATRRILTSLKDRVNITVYATMQETPPDWTEQRNQLFDLLQEYRLASNGKVHFAFKDPTADPKIEGEALQKGIRSMEIKRFGLGLDANDKWLAALRREQEQTAALVAAASTAYGIRPFAVGGSRQAEAPADTAEQSAKEYPIPLDVLRDKLARPCQGRLYYIRYALKMGWTVDQVYELTRIDPWFLENIRDLVRFEQDLLDLAQCGPEQVRRAFESAAEGLPLAGRSEQIRRRLKDLVARAKSWGYSDVQLATVFGVHHSSVRAARKRWGIEPVYKLVDTCAAEFEAYTPYYYSSYEAPAAVAVSAAANTLNPGPRTPNALHDDEIRVSDRPKVVILGGGPNRIGQGIEFDYCCVHAVFAARDMGFNVYENLQFCNPPTYEYTPAQWRQFEAMAQVPTLAIRGENSDILSAETLEEMTRRRPLCESWVVPGQGHAPLLTDSVTIERIRTFVERVG